MANPVIPEGHPWEPGFRTRRLWIGGAVLMGTVLLLGAAADAASSGASATGVGVAAFGVASLISPVLFVRPLGVGVAGVTAAHDDSYETGLAFAADARRLVPLVPLLASVAVACAALAGDEESPWRRALLVIGVAAAVAGAVATLRGIGRRHSYVVLSPLHLRTAAFTVPWSAISSVACADAGMSNSSIPVVAIWVTDQDAIIRSRVATLLARTPQRFDFNLMINVRELRASPFALLAAVTFYLDEPLRRPELGGQTALDRTRSLTDQILAQGM